MRSTIKFVMFVAAVAGVFYGWKAMRGAPQPPAFRTQSATIADITRVVSATGSCRPVTTVQVGSQVSGNIKAIYADFNSRVKQGDLVAQIDPALLEARLLQVQANMDVALAAVVNAQAQVRRSEADIANSAANLEVRKADLVRARLTMEDARTKRDRIRTLFENGNVSAEERDTAQTTFATAEAAAAAAAAQVRAAESGVRAAEAGRDVVETSLASARAQARQTSASLSQAQIDLKHTEIRAPVDGVVVNRMMDVGQTVAASFQAPTIFEIAQDLTKMQVQANVDEADVGLVEVGQAAEFTVDAYPAERFAGHIQQIRKAANVVQNVVTYIVIVEVENNDLKLLPGMTATIHIDVGRREGVLTVPNPALRVRADDLRQAVENAGLKAPESLTSSTVTQPSALARSAPVSRVWRVGGDGLPEEIRVRLGISDGKVTEILEVVKGKLKEGDPVITNVELPAQMGFGPRRR